MALIFTGLLLLLVTALSYLLPAEDVNGNYVVRGKFDKGLLHLNSVQKTDSLIRSLKPLNEMSLIETTDSILQKRFYHGTCRYNFHENWMAYLCGILIWDDLRMIVIPDHILGKKVGACNQINIVFQELLREYGVSYRSVGFRNHLVTEVFHGDSWHVYDADYEADLKDRPSAEILLSDKKDFQNRYNQTPGALFNDNFKNLLLTEQPVYSPENAVLAGNLRTFHYITGFLSNFGWLLLLIAGFFLKYY